MLFPVRLHSSAIHALLILLSSFLLAACGGGGGVGSDVSVVSAGTPSGSTAGMSDSTFGEAFQLNFVSTPSRTAGEILTTATVEVQDDEGRRVQDASNVITLTIAQSSVELLGTTNKESVNGRAVFSDLHINTVGSFVIQATSPGLRPATISGSIKITPGEPSSLSVSNVDLSSVAVGESLSPSVQIGVYDAFGNLVTEFSGTASIVVTSGPTNSLENNTVTFNNGLASFTDLKFTKAGTYSLRLEIAGEPQLDRALPPATVVSRGDLLVSRGLFVASYDRATSMLTSLGVTPPTIPTGTTLYTTALHSTKSVYQSSVGQLIAFHVDPASGDVSVGSELSVLSSIRNVAVDMTDQTLVAGYNTNYDFRLFTVGSDGNLTDTGTTNDINGRPRSLEFVEVNGRQILVVGLANGANINFLALPYDPDQANPFGAPGVGIYVGSSTFQDGFELTSGEFNGQVILYGGTTQGNGDSAVQAFTTDTSGNLALTGPKFDVAPSNYVEGLTLASDGANRVLMVGAGRDLVQYSLTANGSLSSEVARMTLPSSIEELDVDTTGTKLFVSLGGPSFVRAEVRDLTQVNWPVVDFVNTGPEDSLLFLRDPALD